MDYIKKNAQVIDRWVEEGWQWGVAIDHEIFQEAKNGHWQVLLTPTHPVPHSWLGQLKGAKVLGLASGGGQQMPIFTALGAECIVLDNSAKQLEQDQLVAQREGYMIQTIQADMTQPLPFEDESFDLIFHPVSNCYVEQIESIWKECYRVLKRGGRLVSGLDIGINYIVDEREERIVHSLPFNPLSDSSLMAELEACDASVQFSHTLSEQIGGQLRAGFRLVDLYEDTNGKGRLHDLNIPSFIATYSIKD